MNDYLEELVELVWMEEEGLPGEWFENQFVWNGTTGTNREQYSEGGASAWREREAAGLEENVPVRSEGNKREVRDDRPVAHQTGEAGVDRGARALSRKLAQVEQEARYRAAGRQEDQTTTLQPAGRRRDGISGTAGIEARQVDRIFERDARRYDNRYTLF